ncbi:MAG: PH domain-containing protein [Solirubrobacteraceae bacterium]|nr:PH domain-containing protein [Solirubrobacteraceae bacterium]
MTSDEVLAGREPAGEPRHLHPGAVLIEAVRAARGAVFGLIAVLASAGLVVGLAIAAVVLLGCAVFAYLYWRSTTYVVRDRSLHLRTGIVAKREQVVPASRISALDTSRGILQRIFGVVAVQVQTAGGSGKAELELRAVTFAEAERLRHELGHRAGSAGPPAGSAAGVAAAVPAGEAVGGKPTFRAPGALADDAPVVFRLTPRQIVITALTSPSIAVVGAALAGAGGIAQDALSRDTTEALADRATQLSASAVVVLAILFVVVATVISVVGTALLYGGFTITRDDDRLRIRRGILTERVGTVPLDRVHGVRVIESPLRQLLGFASVEAEVAGYAGQAEVSRMLVPLVRTADLPWVLPQIVPGYAWPDAPLEPVPARARRRYLTAPLLTAAVPAIALLLAPIGAAKLLAILPLSLAVVLGLAAARAAGWHRADGILTLRWRTFARRTLLASEHRLQFADAVTNPLQRRASLATFGVRLSSRRGARVRHLDEEVVHDLLARTAEVGVGG